MNLLASLKQHMAKRKLARLVRPDPEYRARRLAQFTPARRERYLANVRKVGL